MAPGGRRSKLQASVFDPQYIQFKPKGAGVTLYFTPEFMRKNQRPNQVNDTLYIPAVPTGRPGVGAPNCPVRALKYYHRYMSEHPELRKGRRCLFIPLFIPVEASLHPSICKTSVHKPTVYKDQPGHSRRRDRGYLLLSMLSYVYSDG